jgi:hypothetical protein
MAQVDDPGDSLIDREAGMTVRRRVLALLVLAGVVAISSALAGKGTWLALTTTTRSRR